MNSTWTTHLLCLPALVCVAIGPFVGDRTSSAEHQGAVARHLSRPQEAAGSVSAGCLCRPDMDAQEIEAYGIVLLCRLLPWVRGMSAQTWSTACRTRVAEEFRKGARKVLFSSDVSARGVDYPDVTMVVQVPFVTL